MKAFWSVALFFGATGLASAQGYSGPEIPGPAVTGTVVWVRSCGETSPYYGNLAVRQADFTFAYVYIPKTASTSSCATYEPLSETRAGHILVLGSSFPTVIELKGLCADACNSGRFYIVKETNVWARSE